MKRYLHPAGIRNGMPAGNKGIIGAGSWKTFIAVFLCVVFVALGGCKSKKYFSKDKISEKNETLTRTDLDEQRIRKEHEFRIFSQQDSGSTVEEILIYPIDTFRYVPGEGYTGRASQVIVRRDANWVRITADSGMKVAVEREDKRVRELTETDQRLNESRKERYSEKSRIGVKGWLSMIGLLMVALITYLVWKRIRKLED